jgi:hypothetical protein
VLALMAALEGRPGAAAALLGYAELGLRQRSERLEPNEARTRVRAEELAEKALGEEAMAARRRRTTRRCAPARLDTRGAGAENTRGLDVGRL